MPLWGRQVHTGQPVSSGRLVSNRTAYTKAQHLSYTLYSSVRARGHHADTPKAIMGGIFESSQDCEEDFQPFSYWPGAVSDMVS